jgi:uncharacterized protein with ATP-grasp and redox domains
MEPLQPIPQCIDCLMSLAKDIAVSAGPGDTRLTAEAERISQDALAAAAQNQSSSPQIANRILREIRQITGIADPFKEFKAREMEHALEIFSRLEARVGQDLKSCARLAALGNSLDFFNNPAQALADLPQRFGNDTLFYRDDLARLEDFLKIKPQRILYFTDNAGEVYFDIPLYEYLKLHCRQVYLVVKGGPALNDLTRVELRSANMTDRFDAVADTGTDGAGIDWENVSDEFLEHVASADLIVSKGMANFETLYPKSISAPSFYLFKVKCEPIQKFVQAPIGSFMALWKAGNCEVENPDSADQVIDLPQNGGSAVR